MTFSFSIFHLLAIGELKKQPSLKKEDINNVASVKSLKRPTDITYIHAKKICHSFVSLTSGKLDQILQMSWNTSEADSKSAG